MGIEPFFNGAVYVNTFDAAKNQGILNNIDDLIVRSATISTPVRFLLNPKESKDLVHFFIKVKTGGPAFVNIYEQDNIFDVTGGTELLNKYNARFDIEFIPGCKVFFNPVVSNTGALQKGHTHLGVSGVQGSGGDSTGAEGIGEGILNHKKLYLVEFIPEFDNTSILSNFAYYMKNPKF